MYFLFGLLLVLWSPGKLDASSYSVLEKIKKHEAQALPGALAAPSKIKHVTLMDGLFVKQRQPFLARFPCSDCHQGATATYLNRARKAHWDVVLEHPQGDSSCWLCHDPASGGLVDLQKKRLGFDESFRLCAQCHFGEHRDWLSGAHGKRLSGWGQERVVETCTGCHNPHRPLFEVLRPKINFTLPRSKK